MKWINEISTSSTWLGLTGIVLYLTLKASNPIQDHTRDFRHTYNTFQNVTVSPAMETLTDLCDATTWHPNVYINCTDIHREEMETEISGSYGLNNVKNIVEVCLRWAIDAGAGFVLPRFAVRVGGPTDWAYRQHEDLSFYLDIDILRSRIGAECPQLKIYDANYPVENTILAEWSRGWYVYTLGIYYKHVENLIKRNYTSIEEAPPVSIHENRHILAWWFKEDSMNVHRSILNAIQFNSYIRSLGLALVKKLQENGNYLGVQLREKNPPEVGYDKYMKFLLKEMREKFPTITRVYVAAAKSEFLTNFTRDMISSGYNIINKYDVAAFNTTLLEEIERLNFDQAGIVETEVLVASTHFYGISMSTFAHNIALVRGNVDVRNCECTLDEGISWGYADRF